MKGKTATCSKCGKIMVIRLKQQRTGDIEHTYFRCPDCGEVYVCYATDTSLRESIDRSLRLAEEAGRTAPLSDEAVAAYRYRKLMEAAQLNEANVMRSRELKALHPLVFGRK